mmetsp:Transcript_17429/g.52388  ORF Transcript_17429/g.52388 Transcript_17429/m.52388 type:complete len:402 (+) Transcript_17429:108-1313(+)
MEGADVSDGGRSHALLPLLLELLPAIILGARRETVAAPLDGHLLAHGPGLGGSPQGPPRVALQRLHPAGGVRAWERPHRRGRRGRLDGQPAAAPAVAAPARGLRIRALGAARDGSRVQHLEVSDLVRRGLGDDAADLGLPAHEDRAGGGGDDEAQDGGADGPVEDDAEVHGEAVRHGRRVVGRHAALAEEEELVVVALFLLGREGRDVYDAGALLREHGEEVRDVENRRVARRAGEVDLAEVALRRAVVAGDRHHAGPAVVQRPVGHDGAAVEHLAARAVHVAAPALDEGDVVVVALHHDDPGLACWAVYGRHLAVVDVRRLNLGAVQGRDGLGQAVPETLLPRQRVGVDVRVVALHADKACGVAAADSRGVAVVLHRDELDGRVPLVQDGARCAAVDARS